MCHISTAEDKAPCLTQTLGPGCLHCKPGKVYMLEKTPFPLAFCCILKQHQVPCFWAWRHEVIPPWRGGRMDWWEVTWGSLAWESRGWGPSRISYGLAVWPWARHFPFLGWLPPSVWRGGTWWPPRSFPALAFCKLWIIYELPYDFLSMTFDLSFTASCSCTLLVPKSCSLQVHTSTWSLVLALSLPLASSLFIWCHSDLICCHLEELALETSAFLMLSEKVMADYGFSSHFTCILGEEQYFNLKRMASSL